MVRTINKGDLDVDDRVASDDAALESLLDALVDRGDVLLRDDTADDGVDELVALAGLLRLEVDDGVTVLTTTTGLANELAVDVLNGLASGLTVGDLRLAHVAVNVELALQAVDDDLEVQLAHAGDDGLTGLLIRVNLEGRVFLGELGETNAHLVLLGLGLGLDGDVDDRVSELDGLEDDGVSLVAQGVTGGGGLEAHGSDDVAGGARVAVRTIVGVHLEDAAQTLAVALGGVVDVGASLSGAGVNAEVGQLTDERVGLDLEGEGAERSLVVGLAGLGLLGLRVGALDGGNVERAREVVDDGVEELLDALVLVGGTDEDEVQLVRDNALAERGLELGDLDLLLHEDLLHEVVVKVGGGVEKLIALGLGNLGVLGRDSVHGLRVDHTLVVFLEVPSGHGDQVDEAPELVLGAHRDLSGDGVGVQALLHGVNGVEEVSANTIILVDEGDARDVVVVSLTPNGLRLRLNAGNGVEDGDGTVEDAEGALDLGREVNVARGVDDLNDVVAPEARGSSGLNGNAALLLLNHPVHGGGAIVDLADLVGLAGVVKDSLGGRGLTGIDVGHDADVTHVLERVLALCHECSP